MLVFWKEKLVVLAVPKTGTTAIETALDHRADMVLRNPPGIKHTPLFRYQRFLAPYLTPNTQPLLETLAVVRHPIDWLGSWYRYRARPEISGTAKSTQDMTFDAFVHAYATGDKAPFANIGSQARFVSDKDGRVAVTHLFQYERQDRLLAFLSDRLKFDLTLPRINVSPRMDLPLSSETKSTLEINKPAEFDVWHAALS